MLLAEYGGVFVVVVISLSSGKRVVPSVTWGCEKELAMETDSITAWL